MAEEERVIYVYDDFTEAKPVLLGKLYVGFIKGGETYSFEYDRDWLKKNKMSINLGKRFDRDGDKRIHFASAMTLLGKTDGAGAADGTGYLDIADFIKAYGSNPKADLIELWKRIVFNMIVTNTDDHLRNHAFILDKNGWTLSPLFDVNPVPYGNELSLLVDDEDNSISIELAIHTASRFGISQNVAEKISDEMIGIVKNNWEVLAKKYGLSRGKIEYMKPAFNECYKN